MTSLVVKWKRKKHKSQIPSYWYPLKLNNESIRRRQQIVIIVLKADTAKLNNRWSHPPTCACVTVYIVHLTNNSRLEEQKQKNRADIAVVFAVWTEYFDPHIPNFCFIIKKKHIMVLRDLDLLLIPILLLDCLDAPERTYS